MPGSEASGKVANREVRTEPHGFVRIRHYGFLASRNKPTELNLAKKGLGQPEWAKIKYSWVEIAREKLHYNPEQCPHCGEESLVIIKVMEPERGPPKPILAYA